jgi:cation transport ATPase
LLGDGRREVGIEEVIADLPPARKAAKLAELQAAGRRVAMVSDVVNDAPARSTAVRSGCDECGG